MRRLFPYSSRLENVSILDQNGTNLLVRGRPCIHFMNGFLCSFFVRFEEGHIFLFFVHEGMGMKTSLCDMYSRSLLMKWDAVPAAVQKRDVGVLLVLHVQLPSDLILFIL